MKLQVEFEVSALRCRGADLALRAARSERRRSGNLELQALSRSACGLIWLDPRPAAEDLLLL
jgi:hypothetical protein